MARKKRQHKNRTPSDKNEPCNYELLDGANAGVLITVSCTMQALNAEKRIHFLTLFIVHGLRELRERGSLREAPSKSLLWPINVFLAGRGCLSWMDLFVECCIYLAWSLGLLGMIIDNLLDIALWVHTTLKIFFISAASVMEQNLDLVQNRALSLYHTLLKTGLSSFYEFDPPIVKPLLLTPMDSGREEGQVRSGDECGEDSGVDDEAEEKSSSGDEDGEQSTGGGGFLQVCGETSPDHVDWAGQMARLRSELEAKDARLDAQTLELSTRTMEVDSRTMELDSRTLELERCKSLLSTKNCQLASLVAQRTKAVQITCEQIAKLEQLRSEKFKLNTQIYEMRLQLENCSQKSKLETDKLHKEFSRLKIQLAWDADKLKNSKRQVDDLRRRVDHARGNLTFQLARNRKVEQELMLRTKAQCKGNKKFRKAEQRRMEERRKKNQQKPRELFELKRQNFGMKLQAMNHKGKMATSRKWLKSGDVRMERGGQLSKSDRVIQAPKVVNSTMLGERGVNLPIKPPMSFSKTGLFPKVGGIDWTVSLGF